mgnify:CR=1 FL=1
MNKTKYYAFAEEIFTIIKRDLDYFSDKDVIKYVRLLENYEFKGRSKTDEPHPNTQKDHLNRKNSNNSNPIGLARATLRILDPFYNANTANNARKSLIEIINNNYSKLF